MKIGIHNIYTSFTVIFLLLCGVGLLYFGAIDLLIPFKLLSVFVVIAMLVWVALLLMVVLKFRILIVSKTGIISLYPFVLKKQELKWADVQKKDFEVSYNRLAKSQSRKVIVNSDKISLSFSDIEFENFERLTRNIPEGEKLLKELNLTYKNWLTKYAFLEHIAYIIIVLSFLYLNIELIKYLWLIIFLLLYASIMRIIRLWKMLKMK